MIKSKHRRCDSKYNRTSDDDFHRNITESELAFRIAVEEPEPATKIQADTYDYYAHYKTWGMEMDYDKYVLKYPFFVCRTPKGFMQLYYAYECRRCNRDKARPLLGLPERLSTPRFSLPLSRPNKARSQEDPCILQISLLT